MRRSLLVAVLVIFAVLSGCGGGDSGGPPIHPPTNNDPAPDSLSGTVTFKGTPLPNATVVAFLTNANTVYQTATTDANGNYTLTGMKSTGNVPGEYQFWVTKNGYGFYPSVGSGGKVMRWDYTGQFYGNGVTDTAIYFTVIDYQALPDGSLTSANFAAYDGSAPLVSLGSTGQQISYAAGDDGAQRNGLAWTASGRFTDNSDGTITDSLTGLVWLKNAGCFDPINWFGAVADANGLASGQCGLTDASSAGQWRLPNLNELESLIDVSASNPALPANHPFANVASGIYWTSTSYFGGQTGSPNAWAIRMSDGRYINDSSANAKTTASNAVWAVKGKGIGGSLKLQATGAYVPFATNDDGSSLMGVPLTFPRWVDNGNGTVTDTMTGLVWLKQANCFNSTWSVALAAVNLLASGQCGLTDGSAAGSWRMPNRNEMQSLSDRAQNNHAAFYSHTYLSSSNLLYQAAIFNNFLELQYYWTSTSDAANPGAAWTVYSCDFGVYDTPKSNAGYTLAVR